MGYSLLNFHYRIFCIIILISFIFLLPATTTAKQGSGTIPVMPGAKIIKQSVHKGSSRLEIATKETPRKAANFYKQAMKRKGWPAGTIMSSGNRSSLMLNSNGRQFALKAFVENRVTKVIMTLRQKEQVIKPTQVNSKVPTASPRLLKNASRPTPKRKIQPWDNVQSSTQEMYSNSEDPWSESSHPLENASRPVPKREIQSRGKVQHVTQEMHLTQDMQINPEDTRPESSQTSHWLYPDFEVTGVAYWAERTRIRAQVKNRAKPFNGLLQFRISLTDPYSSYTLDKVVTVPVSLNADSKWVTLLFDFQWPEPVEYPSLNAVVAVDPENRIKENNDQNNHFQKTMRVSCAVNIEALSNTRLVKGKGSEFAIYGTFGSRQAGRVVCLEKGGSRDKLHVSSWNNGTLLVNMSNKGTGTYDVVVYCSDPDATEAYASNKKTFKIVKKTTKIQISSGAFNAGDMATAMANGYEDWLGDDSTNIKRFWIEDGNPGAIVNCIFTRKPFTVILEILQQDFRVAYQEITDFTETDEGFMLAQAFPGLSPGIYSLKCMQKDYLGIIKHSQSFTFRLQ